MRSTTTNFVASICARLKYNGSRLKFFDISGRAAALCADKVFWIQSITLGKAASNSFGVITDPCGRPDARLLETEVATSRTLEQIAFGNLRPHLFRVEVQLAPPLLASGLS